MERHAPMCCWDFLFFPTPAWSRGTVEVEPGTFGYIQNFLEIWAWGDVWTSAGLLLAWLFFCLFISLVSSFDSWMLKDRINKKGKVCDNLWLNRQNKSIKVKKWKKNGNDRLVSVWREERREGTKRTLTHTHTHTSYVSLKERQKTKQNKVCTSLVIQPFVWPVDIQHAVGIPLIKSYTYLLHWHNLMLDGVLCPRWNH